MKNLHFTIKEEVTNHFVSYCNLGLMSKTLFLLFCVIWSATSVIYAQQTTLVTDIDDLKNTVNAASAGDIIVIQDGSYSGNSMTVTANGTAENPIKIKAQSIGGVTLTEDTKFILRKCSYVILEGFVFTNDGTAVKLEGCNNVRISRNTFKLNETSSTKWVYIGGVWDEPTTSLSHHNRIDHNTFEGKTQAGNFITIDGSGQTQVSQFDVIDHNLFKDNTPRITNEKESIRVGWSKMSKSSGFTVIEFNYFENCNGDPEIISVKTCDNIIRHNTIRNSLGTISLRHGNRSRVEGNYFFGGECSAEGHCSGGVRFYGENHIIINNYFEGLKGTKWDAPITLTEGDADAGNSSLSKHFRIDGALIAYNTLINNDHGIEIGYDNNGKYSKPPRDVVMAYNLVQGSENELVKYINEPDNMIWKNNVMYPTGTATLTNDGRTYNATEISNTNPNLVYDDELNIWKSTSTTPKFAKDNTLSFSIEEDIHGHDRGTESSVGADNYSMESIRYAPLTATDVGPYSYHTDYDGDTEVDYLLLSGLSLDFVKEGETLSIDITTNINWSVSTEADWLSFDNTSGTESATLQVTAQSNSETVQRTAVFTVSAGELSRQVTITQAPAEINLGGVKLPVVEVTATAEQVETGKNNGKENTIDNDLTTRWSAEGEQSIVFDMGENYTVSYLKVAFYKGDERSTHYKVDVSSDNLKYTNIVAKTTSSGTTAELEVIDFTDKAGRYVKLTGFGNTGGSAWNSISEVEIWGDDTPVPITSLFIERTSEVSFYPVPAEDIVYIKNLSKAYTDVSIYNMSGTLLKKGKVQENAFKLTEITSSKLLMIRLGGNTVQPIYKTILRR